LLKRRDFYEARANPFSGRYGVNILNLFKSIKAFLYLTLLLFALPLFICGCGGKTAPDPPRTRSELTLELFDSLLKEDNKGAISLITNLREIDKNNLFLAQLENLEKDNLCILEVQEKLKKDNIADAQKIINKELDDRGRRASLVKAQTELQILAEVEKQVNALLYPENAIQTAKAAKRLMDIAKVYKKVKIFLPFIEEKISQAYQMEENENERSLFDLRSDLRFMLENGNPDVKYLLAQLAVEQPNDSFVNQYVYFINYPSDESLFYSVKEQ
jgi:hypothetical protein